MQENGYMHSAAEKEQLEKMMKGQRQPQVPTKEMRQAFQDQLRQRAQRRDKFKKR